MSIRWPAILSVLLVASACAPALKNVSTSPDGAMHRKVEDGVTTRAELERRLGWPETTLVDGRVAAWNLDKKQRPWATDPVTIKFQLIAVFDDEGIVECHSLLRIR